MESPAVSKYILPYYTVGEKQYVLKKSENLQY